MHPWSKHRRRALFAFVIACVLSVHIAGTAYADDTEAAKVLFDRGIEHLEAGRYDRACPALEQSYKFDPRLGTLVSLAECEAKRGRIATALARYEEYLSLYAALTPDKRAKQQEREMDARAQKKTLERQVPRLTLMLPQNAPRGTVVKLDGVIVAEVSLGVPLAVNPNEHVVTTQAPGGTLTEQRVTLENSAKKQIALVVREQRAPFASDSSTGAAASAAGSGVARQQGASANSASPSGRRVAVYVVGSVGLAGVVFGAVTGGLMLSKRSVAAEKCSRSGFCIDQEGVDAANAAKAFANMSTVGWVFALAGIGTSTVLFLTEPSGPKSSAIRRARVGRKDAVTVAADIGPLGTRGVVFRVGGNW